MAWILAYGCTSAAGDSKEKFWQGLLQGQDHSRPLQLENWPAKVALAVPSTMRTYSQPVLSTVSQKENLLLNLLGSWRQAQASLESSTLANLRSQRLGVILASTKGFIDDLIWGSDAPPLQDTIAPLMDEFLKRTELKAHRRAGVSNACASSLSALCLAQRWLELNSVDQVLLLAADAAGPFVVQGFQSLRVLTAEKTKTFSNGRSGFYLGEATAALLLSKEKPSGIGLKVRKVAIDAEGYAVTRPSQSGESLRRAVEEVVPVSNRAELDLIVAHGTATPVNDLVEDQVFFDLFYKQGWKPLITGTKWSVGHTLGASGALDLIAGCEILKSQKLFVSANTIEVDPMFRCEYLTAAKAPPGHMSLKNFLVTSLGFGGLHAAAVVEKAS